MTPAELPLAPAQAVSWSDHLPALQIVVPLMAAPILVLLRRPRLGWAVSLATTLSVLALAVSLLAQVVGLEAAGQPAVLSYAVGGWAPPWGIELRIDALGGLILVLVSAIAALVMIAGRASLEAEIPARRLPLFYALFLLCLTGLLGMAATGDAFNLFVFLEISSLSTYGMVALGPDRQALVAAYRYLILGTVGATFYVIGIGLLYMMTGTLNMQDLAHLLPVAGQSRTLLVAAGFLLVGLSLKAALFPLHKWLPPAYTHAPSMVTTFLASTATKVSLYVLIRLVVVVLAPALTTYDVALLPTEMDFLLLLALAAMVSGSLVAIFQTNIKRMLAYSSVAQIGYMVLGVSLLSATGLAAGIVHMVNHAVIKATLFLAVAAILLRGGSPRIADMAGLGRQMPWTMGAFVVGGLALIGVPGTAGFVSKWQLILAAFEAGDWWVAVLVAASSLLAVVYIWRVVEVVYFRPAPQTTPAPAPAPGTGGRRGVPAVMLLSLWGVAGLCLLFGLWTDGTLGIARLAADSLLGEALVTPAAPGLPPEALPHHAPPDSLPAGPQSATPDAPTAPEARS